MRHPAEHFIKYLFVKNPGHPKAEVVKALLDWGFLLPLEPEQATYLDLLRASIAPPPAGFDPTNQLHRPSMQYLRQQGVYEMFFQPPAIEEAWDILADPQIRLCVEQFIFAHLDPKKELVKINRRTGWDLTVGGVQAFERFFWNVKLLTFDEWGRFLYGRTGLYEDHMSLLRAPPQLALSKLRIETAVESKRMIQRVQEIAYQTIEEVGMLPGAGPQKVKAIGVLGKTIIECHNAQTTADMAISDALTKFEKFRMEHNTSTPPDIRDLAADGNYTGSGVKQLPEKSKQH